MATTRKTTAPANPLAALAKGATRKPASAKKDDRTVWVLSDPETIDMIRLSVLFKDVKPIAEAHQKSAAQTLFRRWCEDFWKSKKVPDNPRIVVKKPGSDIEDMAALFLVKFRANGLSVPDLNDLPEGTTVEDTIIEALTGPLVGLSAEKATALVDPDNGEIRVEQVTELSDSFNNLYHSEDEVKKSVVGKVMEYLLNRGKNGRITLDAITDEEQAAFISTRQVVSLKDGFLERACMYCDNVDQLHRLLLYVKTTLELRNFEFAKADKKSERIGRMEATVREFLGAGEDD